MKSINGFLLTESRLGHFYEELSNVGVVEDHSYDCGYIYYLTKSSNDSELYKEILGNYKLIHGDLKVKERKFEGKTSIFLNNELVYQLGDKETLCPEFGSVVNYYFNIFDLIGHKFCAEVCSSLLSSIVDITLYSKELMDCLKSSKGVEFVLKPLHMKWVKS